MQHKFLIGLFFSTYFVYEILQIWKKYGFFGHSDAEGIFQKLVKTKNVSYWLLNIDMLHLLVLRRDRVTENSFDLGGNDDTYADGFYDPQWSAFDNLNILGSQSGGPGAIGPNEMLNSYSKYVSGTFLTFFNFISYSFGRGGLKLMLHFW